MDGHWVPPDSSAISEDSLSQLIDYGKSLIANTSFYFGSAGLLSHNANGMNCQNCHLDAGSRPFGNNFGSVAALYPKFRERSGTSESIIRKISDCFRRSLNAAVPDSSGKEMIAMKAYISWLGHVVPKNERPGGTGLTVLPFLSRAADSALGKQIYIAKCSSCHGAAGGGKKTDNGVYSIPPLWGKDSYTSGAGLFRLSKFAAFVKYNMPYGANYLAPVLSDEECWDVAAFVNSQSRPEYNTKSDWPVLSTKPADVPAGPFSDPFPLQQHKFGPFGPIEKWKKQHSE